MPAKLFLGLYCCFNVTTQAIRWTFAMLWTKEEYMNGFKGSTKNRCQKEEGLWATENVIEPG